MLKGTDYDKASLERTGQKLKEAISDEITTEDHELEAILKVYCAREKNKDNENRANAESCEKSMLHESRTPVCEWHTPVYRFLY